MRLTYLLAVAAIASTLTGCQSVSQKSPYEYRFAETGDQVLCLQTEPAGEVSLSLMVRTALEEKGFQVKNVSDFNDPDCRLCVKFTAQMGDWSQQRLKSASLEYVRGSTGMLHRVTTQSEDAQRIFGTPADDQSIIVWTLVDRLFPDPMPWQEE